MKRPYMLLCLIGLVAGIAVALIDSDAPPETTSPPPRLGFFHDSLTHERLLQHLEGDDEIVAWQAVETLADRGRQDSDLIDELIERLRNKEPAIQRRATVALKLIGQQSLPVVAEALRDRSPQVRMLAAQVAVDINQESSFLLELLTHVDDAVREIAAGLLNPNEPAVLQAMLVALSRPGEGTRRAIIGAFEGAGTEFLLRGHQVLDKSGNMDVVESFRRQGTGGIDALTASLRSDDERQRAAALDVLGRLRGKPPETEKLISTLLNDQSELVRLQANLALWRSGTASAPPIAKVVEASSSSDADTRIAAAQALGNLDTEPEAVREPLLALLADANAEVRLSAATALWRTDKRASFTLPVFRDALRHPELQHHALSTLRSIGPAGITLVRDLADLAESAETDLELLRSTAQTLGAVCTWPDPPVFGYGSISKEEQTGCQTLQEMLASDDTQLRRDAAEAVGSMGQRAFAARGRLQAALQDPEPSVREMATIALANVLPKDLEPPAGLLAMRSDPSPVVRAALAQAVNTFRTDAAVDTLIELVRDSNPNVRRSAVSNLRHFGPIGAPAVPVLIECLADKELCDDAAHALSEIGAEAGVAVPTILEAIKARRGKPVNIGPETKMLYLEASLYELATHNMPALLDGLGNSDGRVQQASAAAIRYRSYPMRLLGEAFPVAPNHLPILLARLKSNSEEVHDLALRLLREIEPLEDQAPAELTAALKDEDRLVRILAARLLGRREPMAIEVLIAAVADKENRGVDNALSTAAARLSRTVYGSRDLCVEAVEALGDIGPPAQLSAPALIELLQDNNPWYQTPVARTLGKLRAAAAVPHLIPLLEHEDKELRDAVITALGRIGPGAKESLPMLERLTERDATFQRAMAAVVSIRGMDAAVFTDIVRRGLQNPTTTRQAVSVVRSLDKEGAIFLGDLLAALETADASTCIEILNALRSLTTEDLEVSVQAVAKILQRGEGVPSQSALTWIVDGPPEILTSATPLLLIVAGHKEAGLRDVALTGLERLAPAALHDAVPLLTRLLDEDPEVAIRAAQLLGTIGEPAQTAIAQLAECLESPAISLRLAAVGALQRLDPGRPLLPTIESALEQGTEKERRSAIEICAAMGDKAKLLAPLIRRLLKHASDNDRIQLALVLAQLDGESEEAEAVLTDAARMTDGDELLASVQRLGRAPSRIVLSILARMLRERNISDVVYTRREVSPFGLGLFEGEHIERTHVSPARAADLRAKAAGALGELANSQPEAIPLLVAALADDEELVRLSASDALASLGNAAIPALRGARSSDHGMARLHACYALALNEQESKTTIDDLASGLRENDPTLRETSARLLGRLGNRAAAARPELMKLRDDPDGLIRHAVSRALSQFESEP